ncbi:DEKNAAC100861 [Brettanomyces naardenensis]|uniref:DEKNAAC100861 n=1 Tax=Brettanomyces naardenensis TaxID=13370 RepID=A0A448YFT6_BRENA|nr:DEKNAAC100861 [Brettanomyces naardenensis]
MEDAELNAIRAARLQEMQRNAGQGGGSADGPDGQGNSKANDPAQSMVEQILEAEAKERLSRVRLVKPERAKAVEGYLLRMYQSGAIRRKVNEEQIVDILEQVASDERKHNNTTIVFDRRDKSGEGNEEGEDDFFD